MTGYGQQMPVQYFHGQPSYGYPQQQMPVQYVPVPRTEYVPTQTVVRVPVSRRVYDQVALEHLILDGKTPSFGSEKYRVETRATTFYPDGPPKTEIIGKREMTLEQWMPREKMDGEKERTPRREELR